MNTAQKHNIEHKSQLLDGRIVDPLFLVKLFLEQSQVLNGGDGKRQQLLLWEGGLCTLLLSGLHAIPFHNALFYRVLRNQIGTEIGGIRGIANNWSHCGKSVFAIHSLLNT